MKKITKLDLVKRRLEKTEKELKATIDTLGPLIVWSEHLGVHGVKQLLDKLPK